ncbi:DUF4955 domain-containing protein [Formosa algae]|uniref:DUF4955 domain-containing protein n=1 Tax=Formosa algae TaxID=225843 RepID=UPI000CCF339C|nr:DUF4955 domain-containing protein [Formosa algae]PNW26912.1 hypothetical protein BKP44_15040 [Formosa algae]
MRKTNIYYVTTLFFISLINIPNLMAQEAQIWKKYIGEINNSEIPDLPNYSYAGYKLGAESIPSSNATIFNVTDYGAIANDDTSDEDGIRGAIAAAEAAGGGIVFFPEGEFIVNATSGNDQSIIISGSHIVLRGSGSGIGGTIINMKNVMAQEPGMVGVSQCNPMFSFIGTEEVSTHTNLIADSDKGTNYITVDNASVFNGFKFIRMYMAPNIDANSLYLDGITEVNSIWTNINDTGVEAKEFHEIDYISGNKVYLKDEFIDDIESTHGWTVQGWNMIEESGFEDIHFKANFKGPYVHLQNYQGDSGWRATRFTNAAHCWVRRSRFTNVSYIASTVDSYAISIIQILLDGVRGHSTVDIAKASRSLAGLIWDNTNTGQYHGVNMSGYTTGSVAWRVESTNGRGIDFHGSFPRSNLFDAYEEYDLVGNGGATENLPNHLGGLTLWNLSRVGPLAVSNYNFWWFCNYCAAVVANPIIVGMHGTSTTFNQESVKYEESNGAKVYPESLYEAQIEHRLGTKPAWIDAAMSEFEELKDEWYLVADNYTETINNLELDTWGSVSYIGDNGFNWNVNAKGVSGFIDDTKEIYFQKGVTGITSSPIRGGLNSFSVECKNLWDLAETRKVELLINGVVAGSIEHKGDEVYTFSVDNIDVTEDFVLAIRNASVPDSGEEYRSLAIAFDNIKWSRTSTLSVSESDFSEVKLYPNPSNTGVFNLKLDQPATAVIYDIGGRIIQKEINLDSGVNPINIPNTNVGVYFLSLTNDIGETKIFKLLKN